MQVHDSIAQYLDSYSHERPALVADVSPLTTSTHIIIVCQINIKHKLSLHRHELAAALQTCRQQADWDGFQKLLGNCASCRQYCCYSAAGLERVFRLDGWETCISIAVLGIYIVYRAYVNLGW